MTRLNGKFRSIGLAIKGRCDPVDLSRSEVVLRQYPGGWFPEFKGAFFREDSWDRSDLFMERADRLGHVTMSRFATGAVVQALRRARIGNLDCESRPDQQVSLSVYECGSAHKLPSDIDRRVEDAYRTTGLPRPSSREAEDVTPNDFIERLLNHEESMEVLELSSAGARRLRIAEDDVPEQIVRAMMRYIDAVRPLEGERLIDEAVELGCLWGRQLLRVVSWVWVELRTSSGTSYGLVSGDRALVVFPTPYIRELLSDTDRDNTTLLLFNMIRGGNVPAADPGAYLVIG